MKTLQALVKRNFKIFFKDKGVFFTSLITPAILLVLYVTFLGQVYRDAFTAHFPEWIEVPKELVGGLVGGQLVSSLLAVSCVTVAFCANMLMVSDKASGARNDLTVAPVKPSILAMGYYLAALRSTLLIGVLALAGGSLYLVGAGWYLSLADVLLLLLDVLLLVMFGTALSSLINFFLKTQGQISAVGTIVSSGYGFICGAYMPISNFGEGLQIVISFLPGTYGTALLRNHMMRGAFAEMEALGYPQPIVESIRNAVDCNLYFFDRPVKEWAMYLILATSILLLLGIYVLLHVLQERKRTKA